MKCSGPKAKDADLWMLIWEVRRLHPEGTLLEVEHVKAHRSKKEKHDMPVFERFVAEGNERAEELSKDGAMLDGGETPQIRSQHISAEKRGGPRGFAACSQLSLFGGGVARL